MAVRGEATLDEIAMLMGMVTRSNSERTIEMFTGELGAAWPC